MPLTEIKQKSIIRSLELGSKYLIDIGTGEWIWKPPHWVIERKADGFHYESIFIGDATMSHYFERVGTLQSELHDRYMIVQQHNGLWFLHWIEYDNTPASESYEQLNCTNDMLDALCEAITIYPPITGFN